MADNATQLDVAPLTLIVSDALDPRVRRKLEAEQQADVKTYEEMTRTMQMQEDLTKIKQEVEENGEESDPFKQPEATEKQVPEAAPAEAAPAADPAPAEQPNAAQPADANQSQQPQQQAAPDQSQQQPAADANNQPAPAADQQQQPAADNAGGDDEDLSSAFESYGSGLPKDLVRRVLKDYIKMESSDVESTGELEHIKNFVYINLGSNEVDGDTLESVQTIRDPENTIVVINEDTSPSADVTLRARQVAEQLSNRGVKVFYDADEAVNYLNELYDVVSGRKKEQ